MFYVRNDKGVTQHQSRDLAECKTYIRNSQSLFNVKGLAIFVKKDRKFVPYA